jgi:Protein of unknown function (DUF3017)
MATRPANAGSDRGLASPPPPVHHQGTPRRAGTPPGHRARARAKDRARARANNKSTLLAWLPYLIVLAGVAVGLFLTWQGSRYAGLGTGIVGGALLAAAAARLLLPPRYAELLSSRWKASDVVAFTALGAGVLAIALALP